MGATASAAATALFGFGFEAAIPMGIVNMSEVFLAAWLLRRLTVLGEPTE